MKTKQHVTIMFALILSLISVQNREVETTNIIEIDLSIHSNRFKEIEARLSHNLDDANSYSQVIEELRSNHMKFLSDNDVNSCEKRKDPEKPDYYYFLPMLKANMKQQGDSFDFASQCFEHNKITLEKFTKEETVIILNSNKGKHLLCSDEYWLSTSNIHHIKSIFIHGEHKIILKNLTDDDMDEIKINGIKLFGFCQGFFTFLNSFFMSLKLYLGGLGLNPSSLIPILRPGVPEYMEKANLEFLGKFANFKPASRGAWGKKILEIDEKEIKTGDFIAIYRLDGLDPLIMLGTGSRLGHSAVACWIDGELYVLESQDGWYWPKKGIQRNKWKDWIQWAYNADFNVAILPLKEEIRQKLNAEKAYHWFADKIEGLPYGYHNFLFGWIDTANDNFPTQIDVETFMSAFSLVEKISKKTASDIMTQSLNHRINTKDLSIPQIVAEAARRGLSFGDLISLPEVEGWEYSDGMSYVCSSLVVGFWKAGGIFDSLEMNATEFTPKDIYNMDLFDLDYKDKRPQICKEADPELPYCQVIGRWQVILNNYSSIKPYTHMNEKCPSIAPDFIRPGDC
jgi:hypothetical protein